MTDTPLEAAERYVSRFPRGDFGAFITAPQDAQLADEEVTYHFALEVIAAILADDRERHREELQAALAQTKEDMTTAAKGFGDVVMGSPAPVCPKCKETIDG